MNSTARPQGAPAPSLKTAQRVYGKPIDWSTLNRTASWKLAVAEKQRALATALLGRRLELESCPVCHSESFCLFVEVFGYPYCECEDCGHIFSQRPPQAEAIKALYSAGDLAEKSVQADIYADLAVFATRVEQVAAPKVRFVTGRLPDKGVWVDVGAGVGEVVLAAQAQGWDAVGVESDPDEVAFARRAGADVREGFLSEENVAGHVGKARVVSLFNVLEHVPDPNVILAAIARSVPSGTHIVLEVPRHPSLSSLANRVFPEMAARHIYPPDHLHIFTEKSLALVLERCRLTAQYVWLFGQDFHELLYSMACHGHCDGDPVLRQAVESSSDVQQAIDLNGLSDTMMLVTVKDP